MGSPSRGGGVSQLSLPTPFSPIFVCPSAYRNLSPVLFTHQPFPTYLQFSSSDCPFCLHRPFTYISLLYKPSFCHFSFSLRSVPLEDGILVIEVTVGLQPLSTNTSLWPGLPLDGRSGRPGLTNRLVAPLLWGCLTGLNRGCLTPEYILSIALVSIRRISGEKLTSPCWTRWWVGSGWNEMKMNITMDPQNKKRRVDRTFDNDSDSDYEIRTETMNWSRFLLVESGDDSLPVTKLSPFAIDKGFQALISGRLRPIKRLRNEPSWWSVTRKTEWPSP